MTSPTPLAANVIFLVVGLCALAVVSLVEAITPPNPPPPPPTHSSPSTPLYLFTPHAEEAVWNAHGSLQLHTPWLPPPNPPFLAAALQADHLPGGSLLKSSNTQLNPPWFTKTHGHPNPSTPLTSKSSLLDLLEHSTVSVYDETKNTARTCDTFRMGRWHCGPDSWNWVGPIELNISGKPQTCLWMHPIQNASLRITLPPLPPGTTITGSTALADPAAHNTTAPPVHFSIATPNSELLSKTHTNSPGWKPFHTTLSKTPLDNAQISVTLSTRARHVGQRHFCIRATLQPPRPSP